jgi:flagellar motor switch protein FliN
MPQAQAARALAKVWAEEFGGAVQAMSDTAPGMEPLASPPPLPENLLWWKQNFDLCPGATMWAAAPAETWAAMGSLILSAAGIDEAEEEEQKSTYLEVLKQSLSALARAMGSKAGREVATTEGSHDEPSASAGATWFSVDLQGKSLPPLAVKFSGELLAGMDDAAVEAPDSAPQEHEPQPQGDEPEIALTHHAMNALNLLLDVELPVSISFGCARLRMREVLKLITGSIIELDRSISEPVDVIVNNCVIARGEVVVVEGNYGVRITEVMSRRKRLQETRRSLLPAGSARR